MGVEWREARSEGLLDVQTAGTNGVQWRPKAKEMRDITEQTQQHFLGFQMWAGGRKESLVPLLTAVGKQEGVTGLGSELHLTLQIESEVMASVPVAIPGRELVGAGAHAQWHPRL